MMAHRNRQQLVSWRTNTIFFCTLAALFTLSTGCTEGDIDAPAPSATATPTATPSPTPEESGGHNEVAIGSTEPGAGTLTYDDEFDGEVPVFFSQCLGGTGPDCTGGSRVFTGVTVGFEPAEEDEPEQPLFVLEDGVTLTLEVVQIDPGLSMTLEGVR